MPSQKIERKFTRRRMEERKEIRQRRVARLEKRWLMRFGVSAFIIWHLFSLAIWNLPSSNIADWLAGGVRSYMTATGFMQSWLMFCPNPDRTDLYTEAHITYKDGSSKVWEFPRMVNLGYVDRYRRERFRKFIENAHLDKNQMLWPSMALFAARYNNSSPGNPPIAVDLVRSWRMVPDIGTPTPDYFSSYYFYHTNVRPEDL